MASRVGGEGSDLKEVVVDVGINASYLTPHYGSEYLPNAILSSQSPGNVAFSR